jgi:hypothetical protein
LKPRLLLLLLLLLLLVQTAAPAAANPMHSALLNLRMQLSLRVVVVLPLL